MKKYIIIGAITLIIGAILGYSMTPKQEAVGAISSSGAYNNAAGYSTQVITPSTQTSTTTGILNSGASDRLITGIYTACNNVTTLSQTMSGASGGVQNVASWQVLIGTTTSLAVGNNPTATIFNGVISTSSLSSYVASTTGSILTLSAASTMVTSNPFIWTVGSYLDFAFNGTSSATCTVGADWLAL